MDKNINYIISKINNANLSTALFNADRIGDNITELRIRPENNIKALVNGRIEEIYGTALSQKDLENIFYSFCDYTVSAFDDEISNGYITVNEGIRIGISGHFNYDEKGKIFLSGIYSLNIRIPGASYITIPNTIKNFDKGILIIGKPHSGKTTFLKSIIHSVTNINIVVCDERNELFENYSDCDYICGINKAVAIQNATRSMNPDIIICDEIGDKEEALSMLSSINSGVRFICTAHADNMQSLYLKPNISVLLQAHIFDKIVKLSSENNNFYIEEITDV